MRKGLLYIFTLIGCAAFFSGCLKHGTDRNIETSMTASLGTYTFNASYVEPATVKPQLNDSATSLIIRGIDKVSGDEIDISVTKYKGMQGTFSIANGDAAATYYHSGIAYIASSGVVAIKEVSGNAITGYFSFATAISSASNGAYTVGKPWNY